MLLFSFPFCLHTKSFGFCSMSSEILSQDMLLVNTLHSQLYLFMKISLGMKMHIEMQTYKDIFFCNQYPSCPVLFLFLPLIFTLFILGFPFSKSKCKPRTLTSIAQHDSDFSGTIKFTAISWFIFCCFVPCHRQSDLNSSTCLGQKHCHIDSDEMMAWIPK